MKAAQYSGGYCFRFQGTPSNDVEEAKRPQKVRLGLSQAGLIFEPVCEKGAKVSALEAVAKAKDAEEIKLVTPLAGEVAAVETEADPPYIEVTVDADGGEAKGSKPGDSSEDLRKAAAEKGLWLRITDALKRGVPALDSKPELVIVRSFFNEPYLADESLVREKKAKEIASGLAVVAKMAGCKIAITVPDGQKPKALAEVKESKDVEFWSLPDKYPSENPGLLDGLVKGWKGRTAGRTWVVGLQELVALDELANSGTYDPRWTVALGGTALKKPCHATIWPGTPVDTVVEGRIDSKDPVRMIVGGVINGVQGGNGGWIEPPFRAVTVIPEHVHREFISFMMPGFDKDSFSYGFASSLLPGKKLPVHAGLRGQERYCISCSYCEWVCPADINPQILWKLVDVKELEEAASMGLLRCINCGLCSYVCPCKLELATDLVEGMDEFRKLKEEEAALLAKQEGE